MMKDRHKLKNKRFNNVREKLKFINKKCRETDLFPDLQQLFRNKGYENVEITHGNREFGKDLVFSSYDENLKESTWYSVIVKNKDASQNDFLQGHEIGDQINNSFNVAYVTDKGERKNISKVIIVINGKVTDNATTVIKDTYRGLMYHNIHIWSYNRLSEEFESHFNEMFLNNLEPHINHYQKVMIESLSKINNNSFFDLNIDDINDIFVNVQTTYSREIKKANQYVAFNADDKKVFKDEDIEGSNEIITSNKNFIIHGIATSGKTLFLKRIGIKALTTSASNFCVFYLELDKFSDFNLENILNEKYFEITKENLNIDDFDKIILLLDSIDFISDEKLKLDIIHKIEDIAKNHKYQIVVATRDLNYLKNNQKLDSFEDTELLPFNIGQALQLVKKIIPNNENKTNSFISAIRDNILDSSLQKTPLALTLLAVLYRDDHVDLKELPANIFELYNKFTDIYLDRWDASKGISQQYKYEQTKIIISLIALKMHCLGVSGIGTSELNNFLKELRSQYHFDELDDSEKFIDFLKTKRSVFYYDSYTEKFQFFNHYFQEYFTSLSLEDDEDELFIENFFEQWWHNSLVFYSGKKPRSFKLHEKIINEIVPLNSSQKVTYLLQHSKSLQASHSITIQQRNSVVSKMLNEFDNLVKILLEEAKTNPKSYINNFPYVSFINFSKSLFSDLFSSKHVNTSEIQSAFLSAISSDDLDLVTRYNLAYFLAETTNNHKALENFAEIITELKDAVWSRILYVDISFLRYKKLINEKLYTRLKRRMNKNKYLIQHILSNNVINHTISKLNDNPTSN